MADQTAIEWCDSTFNPWIGCTRVSPACDDCYAARSTPARTLGVAWGPGEPRRLTSDVLWKQPMRWNAKRFMQCGQCGWRGERAAAIVGCGRCGSIDLDDVRRRVFCASLADVFDNEVDPGWRSNLLRLILDTPNLDWLLLTKRIGNVKPMLAEIAGDLQLVAHRAWTGVLPANVWLGATVVNQVEVDRDVPKLLWTPAAVRFLSVEPMLGPINLRCIDVDGDHEIHPLTGTTDCVDETDEEAPDLPGLDWVICGGESGPKARPMHPDWAHSLRDQCAGAGVPFLFKQWGEWAPGSGFNLQPRGYVDHAGRSVNVDAGEDFPKGATSADRWAAVHRAGKKAAGRQLDGRTHDEWPEVRRG